MASPLVQFPIAVWGVTGQTNAVTQPQAPGTKFNKVWGAPQRILLQAPTNIGAGVANTVNQADTVIDLPMGYIFDVVATCHATGTGTVSVDIFNAISGGARIAQLTGPIVLTASQATVQTVSARFQNTPVYNALADPDLNPVFWRENPTNTLNTNMLTRGNVLSLRATTPAVTGLITGLQVLVSFVPFFWNEGNW